jgi:EAL domain-containing protein (putative c-di-GMP-specific phosphodiesterase class I)
MSWVAHWLSTISAPAIRVSAICRACGSARLKIDRSSVNEIESRPETRAMVRSLITLAENMGMRVIIEGVEKPLSWT